MGFQEWLSKWMVLLCAICDGILIGFGIIIGIMTLYYRSTVGGSEGPTEVFIWVAVMFIGIGIVGGVALWKHWWWLLLGVNAGTAFMFVCLVAFTTVAFLIGFNIGDPVKEGVIEGWPIGGRQEYELGGLCDPVDECKAYYPKLDIAMSEMDAIANPNGHQVSCAALDKFELSVNCTRAKDCDYVLGTDPEWGCDNCDDACMKVAIDDARDAMSPLAWGSIFIFSILVLVAAYNDFLMERANFGAAAAFDDGEKDTLEWVGVGLNCLIAFFSLVLVILGGVYAGSGSWTALAILFLGILLLGASVLVAVGLFMQFKLTRLLVFIGNLAIVCLSILLLVIAIVAGLSAGVVTDINEEIDSHWDTIRQELHETNPNYCAYMDDDQCKKKIRDDIEANFYHVGVVCMFVLLFLIGKMFLTHRSTKFFFKVDKDEHAEMHT